MKDTINGQGDPLEEVGTIVLNTRYWDCECEENYIHLKTDTITCKVCGMEEDEMPDSREEEVQGQIYKTI